MTGKTRKMFPGGNTANGFYSFFDYIIPVSYTHLDVYKRQILNIGQNIGKT